MKSFLEWRLAFRNLFRNRRRTLSTSFGLIIAFVGLSMLSGHIIRSEKTLSTMIIYHHHLGHISIYKKDGVENVDIHPDRFRISDSELESVKSILAGLGEEIDKTGAFLSAPGLLSNGQSSYPVWIYGIEPELDQFIRNHPSVKKWTPELAESVSARSLLESLKDTSDAVSLGKGLVELLKDDQGQLPSTEFSLAARSWQGDLNAVNATYIGEHSTGLALMDDVSIVSPLQPLKELLRADGVSHVLVYLKDVNQLKMVLAKIKSEISARGMDLEALSFKDERIGSFYLGTMGFLVSMAFIFGLFSISTVTLIIINSMKMSVMERAKEIGVLRSLGFTPRRIRRLFVKEATWLAFLSCLTGIVITEILVHLINMANFTHESPGTNVRMQFGLLLPPVFFVILSFSIIVIAVFSAYWGAARASKNKITNLLMESGTGL